MSVAGSAAEGAAGPELLLRPRSAISRRVPTGPVGDQRGGEFESLAPPSVGLPEFGDREAPGPDEEEEEVEGRRSAATAAVEARSQAASENDDGDDGILAVPVPVPRIDEQTASEETGPPAWWDTFAAAASSGAATGALVGALLGFV